MKHNSEDIIQLFFNSNMFFKNDGLRSIIYLIRHVLRVIYIVCAEFEVLEDNSKNTCLNRDKKKISLLTWNFKGQANSENKL